MSMKILTRFFALLAGASSLLPLAARADAPAAGGTEFFENKIRPILVNNCHNCHSSRAAKLKGGLSVEFRDAMLKGGENGPALVPGNPDRSMIIKAVRYKDPDLQMPPKGNKLTDQQIADLIIVKAVYVWLVDALGQAAV